MNPKPINRSRTIAAALALAIVTVADLWLELDEGTALKLIRSLEVLLGAAIVVFGRAAVAAPPAALLVFALLLPGCTCPHLESAHRAILTVERDYQGITPLTVHGPEELRTSRIRMLREARLTLEAARGE